MPRYRQISGGPKGENPPEWGTLNSMQVQDATLMEHPNHATDRYIMADDVERLTSKGWKVKDGERVYSHAPTVTKPKRGRK